MKRVTVFISQGSKAWAHNLDDLLERWRERKNNNNPTIYESEVIKTETYDFVNYIRNLENQKFIILLDELIESRKNIIKQFSQGKLKTHFEKEKRKQLVKDIKSVNIFIYYIFIEKNIREKVKS